MGTDRTRTALLTAVVLAALALGGALLALAPGATRLPAGGRAVPVLVVVIGWAFAAVGVLAWHRRPANRTGALLVAFGGTVLLSGLVISDAALPYLVSAIADPLAIAVFLHLLLAFPSGRVGARGPRLVVATAYAVALGTELLVVLFDADLGDPDCRGCPRNLLLVTDVESLAGAAQAVQRAGGLVLVVLGIALTLRRRRAAGAAGRRGLDPLLAAGAAVLALGTLSAVAQDAGASEDVQQAAQLVFIAAFALLPVAFLRGLMRTQFFRVAELAVENVRLEDALRAQVVALRESRARIVETGDRERRRLGRDLHDGAQQRLVSVLIELQLAEQRWDDPGAARERVGRALADARAAVGELRELAGGIHPAVLSQRGLDAALESLAARAAIPVELDVALPERLPAGVETAAYFVVAEALTNVAKHAGATHARVTVRRAPPDGAVVEIADDGAGGAAFGGGTGLRGLEDRVGALDGTLELESPAGGGTLVRACFPLG